MIRFSGKMDAAKAESAEGKLRKWLSAKGYQSDDTVEAAGYDPPFTPGLLPRNEILIRLKQESDGDRLIHHRKRHHE